MCPCSAVVQLPRRISSLLGGSPAGMHFATKWMTRSASQPSTNSVFSWDAWFEHRPRRYSTISLVTIAYAEPAPPRWNGTAVGAGGKADWMIMRSFSFGLVSMVPCSSRSGLVLVSATGFVYRVAVHKSWPVASETNLFQWSFFAFPKARCLAFLRA